MGKASRKARQERRAKALARSHGGHRWRWLDRLLGYVSEEWAKRPLLRLRWLHGRAGRWWFYCGVLVTAVCLRVAFMASTGDAGLAAECSPELDPGAFVWQAGNLGVGKEVELPQGPLYAHWLMPFLAGVEVDESFPQRLTPELRTRLRAAKVAQGVMSGGGVVLLALAGWLALGRAGAFWAGVFGAVYATEIFHANQLLPATLGFALASALLALVLLYRRFGHWREVVLAGFCAGVYFLLRPTHGLVGLVVLAALVWPRRGRRWRWEAGVVYAVCAVSVLLPFAWRNVDRGQPAFEFYNRARGWVTMCAGHLPGASGVMWEQFPEGEAIAAEAANGHLAAARALAGYALADVPGWLLLQGRKVWGFLGGFESPNNLSLDLWRDQVGWFGWLPTFMVVGPLACLGLVFALRRRRLRSVAALALAGMACVLVAYFLARLRHAVAPFWIMLAVIGWVGLLRDIRRQRSRAVVLKLLVVAVLWFALWPRPELMGKTTRIPPKYYRNIAFFHLRQEQFEEAKWWLEAGFREHPEFPERGWLDRMAVTYGIEAGDYDYAGKHVEAMIRAAPEVPDLYRTLGFILEKQGRDADLLQLIRGMEARFPSFVEQNGMGRTGDHLAALLAAREQVRRQPDDPMARFEVVKWLYALHRLDAVIEEMEAMQKAFPAFSEERKLAEKVVAIRVIKGMPDLLATPSDRQEDYDRLLEALRAVGDSTRAQAVEEERSRRFNRRSAP